MQPICLSGVLAELVITLHTHARNAHTRTKAVLLDNIPDAEVEAITTHATVQAAAVDILCASIIDLV